MFELPTIVTSPAVIALIGIAVSMGMSLLLYAMWKRLRDDPGLTVRLRVKDKASRKINRIS